MFHSIVVAYDGSEHACKALEVAVELALARQARLGIIYVIETDLTKLPNEPDEIGAIEHLIEPMPELMVNFRRVPVDLTTNVARTAIEAQQAALEWADHLVTAAAQHSRSCGVQRVEATTVTGDSAEEVVEFANSRNADLIVCGCRGLGRVKQLLLGSTSHKILQLASCSCLTIK